MTRSPATLPLLALAAALAVGPSPAAAWSTQGHRVAAAVAEERLTPAARRLVRELLGATPMSDARVAGWADAQREPATRPWHYVNIPPGAAGYVRERDCPGDACIVAAMERAVAELRDGDSAVRRADAFRWLVHLAADVHQPLHADGRDRGGTELETRTRGGKRPRSLHRVWDEDVLRPILYRRGAVAAGRALAREVRGPEAAPAAAEPSPAAWANESHALARALYAELEPLPREGRSLVLPDAYPDRQRARAEAQLQKAGVRLAALLDRIALAREARAGRR
ncbi:S1/P1 nuclease [Anaeromyxobacter sp. SG17]|uniref:S1/P1 nuclease n=1 Tax=Anaeromyxobacter sp. SG17 TaxID=2925405 RepID=UPI001F57C525|nr:S1/P1 nuclease [Anaeromyxobacter sp. SG17]